MRHLPLASLLAVGCAYGCSLINAPDDLVTEAAAGSSMGATGATSPNAGADAVGGQEGVGGTSDSGGTNGSGAAGGEDPGIGGAGGAEDPGPGPNPTTGLVVLGAEDADMKRHLLVLNARTGAEIRRDPLPVAAVAYDEAPARHVWFAFTASSFPAPPTGVADLEVRRFHPITDKWSILSKATALPPPQADQLLVLNDRLVYLSSQVVDGSAVSSLTLLDTSDLADVRELTTRTADAGETFVGLVGDRGSDVDAEAPGGRIRLMIAHDCVSDGACELSAQQLFVSDDFTAGTSVAIDTFVGQPRFAKAKTVDRLFAVLRSTTPSDRLVVRSYQGPNLTNPTAFALAGFVGQDVGGFALAECAEAGAVTDVDGAQLIGFNLTSGMQQAVDLAHPGAPLYTEPFAPSLIALDPAGTPGLRSFEVSRSGTTNVAVNERSLWNPAGELSPFTGAMRRAETSECP